MNANGYGNCQKIVPRGPLKGMPICYGVQPSGCSDLRGSKNNTGELVSAEACVGKDAFDSSISELEEDNCFLKNRTYDT